MKTVNVPTDFERRAAQALTALLDGVSAIKLLELKCESQPGGPFRAIRARVDVLGHTHTLACEVDSGADWGHLRALLRDLEAGAQSLPDDATPLIIAPYLPPKVQALCKESKTGFLDFEGNARLTVGEFFVVMRSLPRDAASRASAIRSGSSARSDMNSLFPKDAPNFSCKQPQVAVSA